jgi:GTP-binding protein EngB required for normal cell division
VILSPTQLLKMAACKKRFLSENEMERILEDSGSECDEVFSKSDDISESESEENADESAVEILDNSDNTAPPALIITKKEGWKWSVTGDKPSKYHFTGNP